MFLQACGTLKLPQNVPRTLGGSLYTQLTALSSTATTGGSCTALLELDRALSGTYFYGKLLLINPSRGAWTRAGAPPCQSPCRGRRAPCHSAQLLGLARGAQGADAFGTMSIGVWGGNTEGSPNGNPSPAPGTRAACTARTTRQIDGAYFFGG